MSRKIPPDEAFMFYMSLGAGRSYQAVADKYKASKQAVTKLATRENWQTRLAKIERDARERSDQKATETLEQMTERHLRSYKAMQAKALDALRAQPLGTAMEAVRSLDLGIRGERLLRGEPTDRTVLNVEEVIKREYENWMSGGDENADDQSPT